MRLLPLLSALTVIAATPSWSQSLRADEVFSSITLRPVADIHPVLGADDRIHLAYELEIDNPSQVFVTLDKVEAVDDTGASLETLAGDELTRMTRRFAGSGNTLAPGQGSVVFMDVSLARGAPIPKAVSARIALTRQAAKDGKPAPYPANSPIPRTASFTGAKNPVGQAARVIEPPLHGSGWVAVNGCCDSITSHRGALIPIDGHLNVPERFAIDWVKLDDKGRLFTGDGSKLTDFAFYGDTIHSVADGVVVTSYDEADEQIPLKDATGLSPASIGGNMLVVDIGDGAYAFYAHLQRGSLRVRLGDHVKTGQVLGLLGNTGNTNAPHLHFHLMDTPTPLNSNGIPFVFTRFTGTGVITDKQVDEIFDGKAITPGNRLAGPHSNQLPLNNEVVTFE
jgi:murein DD-endopeptidase MepM/ murein hydrolase activator NlpD